MSFVVDTWYIYNIPVAQATRNMADDAVNDLNK